MHRPNYLKYRQRRKENNLKDGIIQKSAEITNDDLLLINGYTRKPLTMEEVYTFSVILCDNEVDRDFEMFSVNSLEKLGELFVGKTGIFDHDRRSTNQTTRIFRTRIEKEEGKLTSTGEAYVSLAADAYIPRTEKNREVIEKIDSGILKEVSIGCSVRQSVCSICGKESCSHIKGRSYKGKTCVKILEEPADAYEFSFVAVPAQRNAGVKKSFEKIEEEINLTEKIKNLTEGQEITLSFEEIKELKEAAMWGESYKNALSTEVKKYSRMVQPQLSEKVLEAVTNSVGIEELKEMAEVYRKMAEDALPINPQLSAKKNVAGDNGKFRI